MVSTATILHACEGILLDDYLEPFVEPMIAARPVTGTMPQYENMGHIMTGIEGLHTAGTGNVMTIDRGTNAGVVVGQRFLVFRDKRQHQGRNDRPIEGVRDRSSSSRRSLKLAKCWSYRCGRRTRPFRLPWQRRRSRAVI